MPHCCYRMIGVSCIFRFCAGIGVRPDVFLPVGRVSRSWQCAATVYRLLTKSSVEAAPVRQHHDCNTLASRLLLFLPTLSMAE
jgi:hypothetical protein